MSYIQGQHVIASFPSGDVVATVLEIRGEELLVQEQGTERAELIPADRCRPR
ncbi:hypothetical protein [Nitriliruptor alkaliphilus]|uniref:hypothetical protein n=1 Tax=Nitriliruptor alkaliphilus TaxID=427918 RepID=UPI00146FCF0E|nr:hypothetical protein [Nitriliruptor alkaliphilus]